MPKFRGQEQRELARNKKPLIYLVDPNTADAKRTKELLDTVGWSTKVFAEGESFLAKASSLSPGCLITEIRLPLKSGPALIEEVVQRVLPIICLVLSRFADVDSAVASIRAGAIDLFQKPPKPQAFLDAVQKAVDLSERRLNQVLEIQQTFSILDSLTERECEIVDLLVSGLRNSEIAKQLKIQERTIEVHRANIMRKFDTSSITDIYRRVLLAKPPCGTPCFKGMA